MKAFAAVMQGTQEAVVVALDIICDAVDRYKELCEGRFCGKPLIQIHQHLTLTPYACLGNLICGSPLAPSA